MRRALLIDKNYIALSIISWRKAAKLMVKGKAEGVTGEDYNAPFLIRTGEGFFRVPSVIRLVDEIPWRAHSRRVNFSKKNLMLRDDHTCQYCGVVLGKSSSTIDHVIPKAAGGKTNYKNCVICCRMCNILKADKKPEDVGFQLLTTPRKPTFKALYMGYLEGECPDDWRNYIMGER